MSEFSVNTDKISSLADLLEQQAKALETDGSSVDSIRNQLSIHEAAKAQVMSAMRTTSDKVREESSVAARMSSALKEIAAAYRSAENNILGYASGGSGGSGFGGSGGGSGSSGPGNGTQNGNHNEPSEFSSDPVNLNTGNFILDNYDMKIPGFRPLVLRRFYNSMGTFTGMLGSDWNTSFEIRISLEQQNRLSGADACVMLEDGREEYFATADGKQYVSVTGSTADLVRTEDGFTYSTLDGNHYYFDADGRYIRFEDPHQIGFSLIYEGDALKRVEKDSGEFFTFTYNDRGLLAAAEDHTGRACQYVFEDGRLQSVTLPDGNAYQYSYNQYGKICRVLNPRQVHAVETEYDTLYRVVYQRFADGTTNKFEYLDGEQAVVMTERNGSKSVHYHNEKYQNVRNVYLDGEESFEYNERGQKTVIVDKLGNVMRLQYDNRGNIASVLTADKTKISLTYNQQNRLLTMSVNGKMKVRNQYNHFGDLISEQDGIGRETVYTYNEHGRIIGIRRPDGSMFNVSYDEHDNLSSVVNANGGTYSFEYDEMNQLVCYTDALGQRSVFSYDMMGRVILEGRADGCSREYQYDEWGNLTAFKDFDGEVTVSEYNENNRPVAITDAAGRRTYFTYDSMWNIAGVTLPNGGTIQYLYDANNRLESVRDAEGYETRYEYDALGNILSQTNAEGIRTGYARDPNGRCTKVTAADGTTTEYRYDEEGHVIYIKDAEGTELFRTFDAAGQLTAEEDSLGRTRNYTYDDVGNLISAVDEKGQTTSWRYEAGLNKAAEIFYPNGTSERYTYDLNGNVRTHTDIYGRTICYQYDVLGRIIAICGEQGTTKEYQYDPLGRITEEKDFEGNTTKYEYSVTGQLLAVVDALGHRVHYSYDEMDELTGISRRNPDTGGSVCMTYERSLTGQITRLTDALGKSETYQYNGLGQMTEKVDRDGYRTQYSYNNLGLLQSVKWADGRETVYQYNQLRRLCEVRDWTGVTRIRYDAAGNPLQITYPDERSLSFSYDAHGNRTGMNYPNGRQVMYEYDVMNRLERVIRDGQSIVYTYDPSGNIASRSLSDGSRIQYQYDDRGLLSRMTHTDSHGILDNFSFEYDPIGRRKRYEIYRRDYAQDNGIYEYDYDSVGRLCRVDRDSRTVREYTYDAFGNRSSMVNIDPQTRLLEKTGYEYDSRGGLLRMVRPGLTEEYRYDQRGNLTELLRNGQMHRTYQYDAFNRLAGVQSDAGDKASYQYNGLGYRIGMRIQRNGHEESISYALDYSRIYDNLIERNAGEKAESYIWGIGLEGFATLSGDGGWYLTDPLGSILRKTGGNGTLLAENYDEFGSPSSPEVEEEQFGYNGFLFDPMAGTYFAQARQYRSYTGTFDAMDRFGGDITMPETLNPYSYCIHDPFSHTDKSAYWFGLDDAIAAGIGAIGGVAGQFFGDVFEGVTTGDWKNNWSSWQEYTGSAIGGAAGGVTTLYAGPIAGGAVSAGTTTLTTEGLTWLSNPQGYTKSFWDVVVDTVVETGFGALSGVVSKGVGKLKEKLAGTRPAQWLISKLRNGGKTTSLLANHIDNLAKGKSTNWWSQMSDFLKNQHEMIAGSGKLKQKLFHTLLTSIPIYAGQEILNKFISILTKPLNALDALLDFCKEKLSEWIKTFLGLNSSSTSCAAAPAMTGGGGGAW